MSYLDLTEREKGALNGYAAAITHIQLFIANKKKEHWTNDAIMNALVGPNGKLQELGEKRRELYNVAPIKRR